MGERHDLPTLGAVSSPGFHQHSKFLKQVTTTIHRLDLGTDGMDDDNTR
jgi:hypothetical protein